MSFSPNRPPCGLNDGSSLNWEIEIYDRKYYKENIVDSSGGSKMGISQRARGREGGWVQRQQIQEKTRIPFELTYCQ